MCRKRLSTGEQLYVVDDNKYMCKDDYLLGKQSLQSSLAGKNMVQSILIKYFSLMYSYFGYAHGTVHNDIDLPLMATILYKVS